MQKAVDTSAQTGSTTPGMVDMAVVSYGAVFADGGATLSYGDGTITGDIQVDINTSSLGAYTLVAAGPMPAGEADALNFVLANFPGLGGLTQPEARNRAMPGSTPARRKATTATQGRRS